MGLMPISDLLALAEQQRGAGRLADAEATCRRILATQPDEPNALSSRVFSDLVSVTMSSSATSVSSSLSWVVAW